MTFSPGDLETLIANAANSGWDFIDQIADPAVRDRVNLVKEQKEADRQEIDAAWASFAASPGGHKALQEMLDTTLNRTVFFVNLGQGTKKMALWGSFREGQNSLAHAILRHIVRGRDGKREPKPRDV